MKHINIFLSIIVFMVFSCSDTSQDNMFDESALIMLLDQDEAAGLDGFDDNGIMEMNYDIGLEYNGLLRSLGDTLGYGEGYRVRFGRQITNRERTVDFVIDGDTAVGTVNYILNGVFMAEAMDTSNMEPIDSLGFTKDFTSSMTRKVKFVRVDNSNTPEGYNWRIVAMTPLAGGSGDKISIASVEIHSLSIDGAGTPVISELLYSFSSDNMGDLFINRESLPSLTSFDPVLIKVEIENTGPEFSVDSSGVGEWVTMRYGRSSYQRGRRHLNDKGYGLDSIVNDNTHSGLMRVHGPGFNYNSRVFKAYFTSTDLATLFTEDGGYNSITWSIPYRTIRPE